MSTSKDLLREHAIKQIMAQLRADYEKRGLPVPSDQQLHVLAAHKHDKDRKESKEFQN
jgi:hypothetical protein